MSESTSSSTELSIRKVSGDLVQLKGQPKHKLIYAIEVSPGLYHLHLRTGMMVGMAVRGSDGLCTWAGDKHTMYSSDALLLVAWKLADLDGNPW